MASLGLTEISGDWTVLPNKTIIGKGKEGILRYGSKDWINMGVSFTGRIKGGRKLLLAVRAENTAGGKKDFEKQFRIAGYADLMAGSVGFHCPELLKSSSFMGKGTGVRSIYRIGENYHTYKLIAKGNVLQYFVDGRSKAKSLDHEFHSGYIYIGFSGNKNTVVELRNLKALQFK